jgi:predicted ATPase
LVQLLPELREHDPDLPSPDLAETHPEEKVSQAGFYESIIQYTFALSKQAPIVMFLDDLQWTDSATLDLLQYAIRRWRELAAPVLLLVSLRSEALHSVIQPQQIGSPPDLSVWFSRIERELKPVIIELEPLGEQETVQLVLSILSPPVVDFAQWLYSETRGQPFYLMETLKDLLERGVLSPKRKAEGEWSFALDVMHDLGQAVRVPSTVHAVISSRLNRLSPNAFSLLAAGAVLEQPITFKHLCAVSNVTEDLALPAIDELISARLLLEPEQTVVLTHLPTICSAMWFIQKLGMPGGDFFINEHWRYLKQRGPLRQSWLIMPWRPGLIKTFFASVWMQGENHCEFRL